MDFVSLGRYIIEDYIPTLEFQEKTNLEELKLKNINDLTDQERGLLIFNRAREDLHAPPAQSEIPRVYQLMDDWEVYRSHQELVESQILESPPEVVADLVFQSRALPAPPSDLKKMQIAFLKKVGKAFYTDVLPHTSAWLRNQILNLLGDPLYVVWLVDRLAGKKLSTSQLKAAPKASLPKEPKASILWEISVADQTIGMLQAIATTLGKVIASPDLREEFKSECSHWIGKGPLHEEVALTLQMFAPDVAFAFVKSLIAVLQDKKNGDLLRALSQSLGEFVHQQKSEQLRTCIQLTIEKAVKEPFESATETFFAKLFDPVVTDPLFEKLEEILLLPFFPPKDNFPAEQRKGLVHLMEGVAAFFKTLNEFIARTPAECKSEQEKVQYVINGLSQKAVNLVPLVMPRGIEQDHFIIHHLIKEWVKQVVEDPAVRDKLEFAIPLAVKILIALVDVPTLDVCIATFLKHPTTFYNPFESDPEPLEKFDNSDQEFNKEFAIAAALLKKELIDFCPTNFLFKKAADAALSLFLPIEGAPVQRALNRLAQSGTRLLPVMAVTHLSWVIPILPLPKETTKAAFDDHGRRCLNAGLAEGNGRQRIRSIDFEKLMNQSPEQQEALHHATRKMILGTEEKETKLLRSLLSTVSRVSSLPLETIQKFYRFAEHTPFWRAFLITILYHLTKKKDHGSPSPGTSPTVATNP